ncbi:PA14 domain-containing protein [Methanocella sp. MCL-LM]|uniref:PA14 domain-containing protein n=1 Tax=Methanocella sp. MCL-LM TaxID=3412035 RepID=UPI003C7423BC
MDEARSTRIANDEGISDAFFTVMSIGIVVVAGILIASIVITYAGSQGKAASDRLEGLQEPGMERGVSALYYTIDPSTSDLSSADPNKIPPDSYVSRRTDSTISTDRSSLPGEAPATNGMVIWTGYVIIPSEGDYTFTLDSAGGSWLWIDGRLIADNHGNHPRSSVSSTPVHLSAGQHRIKARYYYTNEPFCRVTCSQDGRIVELRYCH